MEIITVDQSKANIQTDIAKDGDVLQSSFHPITSPVAFFL
jgi:hypothetical protein